MEIHHIRKSLTLSNTAASRDMANNKHRTDHIIDDVFYCGVNNVITVAGIVGNVILLVIFMRPHLIRHRSILHTYLKVCYFLGIKKAMRDSPGIFGLIPRPSQWPTCFG